MIQADIKKIYKLFNITLWSELDGSKEKVHKEKYLRKIYVKVITLTKSFRQDSAVNCCLYNLIMLNMYIRQ